MAPFTNATPALSTILYIFGGLFKQSLLSYPVLKKDKFFDFSFTSLIPFIGNSSKTFYTLLSLKFAISKSVRLYLSVRRIKVTEIYTDIVQ